MLALSTLHWSEAGIYMCCPGVWLDKYQIIITHIHPKVIWVSQLSKITITLWSTLFFYFFSSKRSISLFPHRVIIHTKTQTQETVQQQMVPVLVPHICGGDFPPGTVTPKESVSQLPIQRKSSNKPHCKIFTYSMRNLFVAVFGIFASLRILKVLI